MFSFTIRDVLWLMALLATGMAWQVDHRKLVRRAQAAEDGALLVVGEAIDDFPQVGPKWQLTPIEKARLQELRTGR
jgi:hypothetical protein